MAESSAVDDGVLRGGPRGSKRSLVFILAWLVEHRLCIALLYGVVISLVYATLYLVGPDFFPNLAPVFFGDAPDSGQHVGELKNEWLRIACIIGYVVLQFLFVSGAGKLRVARGNKRGAALVALPAAAIAVSVCYAGLVLAAEIGLRITPRRQEALYDTLLVVAFFAVGWLIWGAVIFLYVRHSPVRGPSRVLTAIIAGSWVEFVAALPVDASIRQGRDNCYCYTGSWVALVIAMPALVWCVGPGIFLLYWYEREQPGEARSVLRRKTRFERGGRVAQ
jgi:hypothetical protein